MVTKNITLKAWSKNEDIPVIKVSQGEILSRELIFYLIDNNGEFINLSNSQVNVHFTKPDKTIVYIPANIIDDGKVSVSLTSQVSAKNGIVDVTVEVIKTDKSILFFKGLNLFVQKNNVNESIESSNEFTILTQALTDIEDVKNSIDALESTTINGKPLTGDIDLEASDIYASRTINGNNYNTNVQSYLMNLDTEKVTSTRKINSKPLTSDITLTSGDIGAVPTSRKVNGKALTTDITLSATDVSAVPVTRKINSKVLNSDITLTAADIGAIPTTAKGTANGVVALPASLPPVGSVLSMGTNGTAATAKFDDFSASVQSGSNANGHYIKYPNGTMICYGNPSYTLPANAWGNSIVWSYPTSFAAIPVVTTTIAADTQAATFNLNVGYTNNNQVFFHIKNNGTTERNINVNCMAIGRWK